MIRLGLFIILVQVCQTLAAQNNYSLFRSFTTNDGLPSNHIYQCVEDNKGFLWVATEAGLARFDGKYFQVFTVQNGLPDDEVLGIVKEKNGRIWVNCFKPSPAYFDELQNRFINAKEDTLLARVKGISIMYLFALPDGAVLYKNEMGSYVFKDGKVTEYISTKQKNALLFIKTFGNENLQFGNCINKTHKGYQFAIRDNDRIIDSINIFPAKSGGLSYGFNENKFYLLSHQEGKCFIYSNFKVHPISFSTDSVCIPEPIFWYGFTANYLNILGKSGKIYVFDKATLQKQMIISGNYSPTYLYNDKQQNIWISTVDKGLLLYKKQQIDHVALPENYTNTNFLSVAKGQNGLLLAGNFYSEIFTSNVKSFNIKQLPIKGNSGWQRKIILSQNKIFTFSEGGIYINYKKLLLNSLNNQQSSAKTAIVYNDSSIIVGHSGGIFSLNSITEKLNPTFPIKKRVTALAKAINGTIYFGSTDGLYKYDLIKDTGLTFLPKNPLFEERVTALCFTKDNLLWMATASNGIVAVRDDKVVQHITMPNGIISNSCKSITAAKDGQIWLGTNQGISIIKYQLNSGNLQYTVQNLSINDGLSSNSINEMLYQNDTVYAATGNGISIIPTNIAIATFNIPVQLIGVRINQKDTILSNEYQLNYNQQNIQLQFAGIELGGHFKNLQYSINNSKDWITLNENVLSLQLNNGKHIVQIRAVDVNGNVGDKMLTLQFTIATPFWMAAWFWLLVGMSIAASIISLWIRSQHKAQQRRIMEQKALEEQRKSITADLHDEVGASLSSLQLNSAIAQSLIEKDLQKVKPLLEKIEQQSKDISLKMGDIIWSMKPGEEEFIPLSGRIKNYVQELLGSTTIYYSIQISKVVDETISNIIARKNILLITKEAVNNAAKYSKAKSVTIKLELNSNNLLLQIIDDGIGFDATVVKGNGINNIRKRANEMNAICQISSALGKGTCIQLSFTKQSLQA